MKFLAASALLAAASAAPFATATEVGNANPSAPKYVVTVSDGRSVANAVGVAAPLKTSTSANFAYSTGAVSVQVSFADAVSEVAGTPLTKTGDATLAAGSGSMCETETPTKCRTWTYTLTGTIADGNTVVIPAGAFSKAYTSPAALAVATSDAVTITLKKTDALAEVAPDTLNKVALNTAALDTDFWYYIPSDLFSNVNGDLEIIGGTPSVSGLSVVPGKVGRAAIAGRMTALPSNTDKTGCWTNKPQVSFILNARDASGATTTTTLCVGVEAAPGSATSAALGTTPITYSEGGAGVPFFSTAPANLGLATKVFAYIESPDAYSASEAIQGLGTSSAEPDTSANLISANKVASLVVGDLASVNYVNTNQAAKGSSALVKRTARVVLTKAATGFDEATNGVVLAVGSRPINHKVVNAAPTVTSATSVLKTDGTTPIAVTFNENASTEKVLFADAVLGDVDDSDVRYVTVAITGNYKKGLDMLAVESFAASEKVTATWSADNGVLTLSPAAGAQSVSRSDMQTVLRKVAWMPLEEDNVNGRDMPVGDLDREIIVTVVDNGATGLTALTNSVVAKGKLTVSSVADAPTLVKSAAYGVNGALSSKDAAAEKAADINGFTGFDQYKPVVIVPATVKANDVITAVIPIDFSRTGDGVYLGGAISYKDKSTTTPTISFIETDATWTTPTADTSYSLTPSFANNKLDVSFTYTTDANLGAKAGLLRIDGTDLPFSIDIRKRKCAFDANYAVATHYPDASLCTTPVSETFNAGAPATLSLLAGNAGAVGDKRGNTVLTVPGNAASGTVALKATPASAANLPPLPTLAGVQGDLAVSFGPDGTVFSSVQANQPKVCINIGAVPAGKKGFLAVTSQANGKFGAWETLATAPGGTASVMCGYVPHFSVVAPVFVNAETLSSTVSTANTASKLFQMGASCANGCSGKGFCREHGQCQCFDGFTGYDCSLRTCPFDQSWDLPADGSVAHNEAECSSRGACDRKAGVCACFPGFEGAACQRVSCPSDCNGHGKCRLAKELPAVAASFANQWESERVQVCECDAGYQGYDCAERICPFGDDPESVCKDTLRQKQKVTIDFGTVPSTATNAAWTHLGNNDELTLGFKTRANHVLNTPTVGDLWSASEANLQAKLKAALTSLPEFAVSDVSVAATRASTTAPKVDLEFEFTGSSLQWEMTGYPGFTYSSAVAGNTVSGDQNKFMCDLQGATDFINGCVGQGCRPAHKQARLFESTVVAGSSFATLNDNSVLQQLASNGAVDFNTPGVWGMEVVVTVNSDGTAASYKYEVNAYGQSYGNPSEETPLPPIVGTDPNTMYNARKNVPIAHGLFLDFAATPAANQHQMVFSWRLPKCSVEITQNADEQFESAECSKRGSCDRKTGTCKCYPGYSGYNCGAQQIAL